jgi:hypothetical protein
MCCTSTHSINVQELMVIQNHQQQQWQWQCLSVWCLMCDVTLELLNIYNFIYINASSSVLKVAETLHICTKKTCLSMKWVGCLNHNLKHDPSEKPSESPTAATVMRCESKLISAWVASLWLLATIAGAETLYLCMKYTCYEYEVGRMPHHNLRVWYIWVSA